MMKSSCCLTPGHFAPPPVTPQTRWQRTRSNKARFPAILVIPCAIVEAARGQTRAGAGCRSRIARPTGKGSARRRGRGFRHHQREHGRSGAPVEERVDVSKDALRARTLAERAGWKSSGHPFARTVVACGPAMVHATRLAVTSKSAPPCGIDGVASRLEIGDRGLVGSDDQPRPGTEPQRGECPTSRGRVRRDG